MGFAPVIAGLGAFQAVNQIQASQQQAKAITQQAEYNAQVYEQQGESIKQKQALLERSDLRQAAKYRGAIVASAAGRGLMLSGSPLAILADTEAELQLDRAIGQYNLNMDRQMLQSQATATRTQGKMDAYATKASGISNAFSTMLSTGYTYGSLYGNPFAKKPKP